MTQSGRRLIAREMWIHAVESKLRYSSCISGPKDFRMIKILLLVAFQSDLGLKSVTSAAILCRSVVDVWFWCCVQNKRRTKGKSMTGVSGRFAPLQKSVSFCRITLIPSMFPPRQNSTFLLVQTMWIHPYIGREMWIHRCKKKPHV